MLKAFFKRREIKTQFQTRHDEHVIKSDTFRPQGIIPVINIAYDPAKKVCSVWYHQTHFECYPSDARAMCEDLIAQLNTVVTYFDAMFEAEQK